MRVGLIAEKVGMARVITKDGLAIPVTLLKIPKQQVSKVLKKQEDGYDAYQLGYASKGKKDYLLTKADINRLRKSEIEENYSKFKEFRTKGTSEYTLGQELGAEIFKEGAYVDITGKSRGRGFQGSVKRWGSAIGRMTHGSRFHRRPGSLGQCTTPGRVFKNKHQPGQMGTTTTTVLSLPIIDVDIERSIIAVKGSVPGCRKSQVEIRESQRKS